MTTPLTISECIHLATTLKDSNLLSKIEYDLLTPLFQQTPVAFCLELVNIYQDRVNLYLVYSRLLLIKGFINVDSKLNKQITNRFSMAYAYHAICLEHTEMSSFKLASVFGEDLHLWFLSKELGRETIIRIIRTMSGNTISPHIILSIHHPELLIQESKEEVPLLNAEQLIIAKMCEPAFSLFHRKTYQHEEKQGSVTRVNTLKENYITSQRNHLQTVKSAQLLKFKAVELENQQMKTQTLRVETELKLESDNLQKTIMDTQAKFALYNKHITDYESGAIQNLNTMNVQFNQELQDRRQQILSTQGPSFFAGFSATTISLNDNTGLHIHNLSFTRPSQRRS